MRITANFLLIRLLKRFHSTLCYVVCLSIVSLFLILMSHTAGTVLLVGKIDSSNSGIDERENTSPLIV